MSRRSAERLEDVLAAVDAIRGHTARGELADGLIFDAVRVRLIEIGEAIKDLPAELLATEPDIPWQDIARMRDRLATATSTRHTRSWLPRSPTTCRCSRQPSVDWPSVSRDPDWGARPEASDKQIFGGTHLSL